MQYLAPASRSEKVLVKEILSTFMWDAEMQRFHPSLVRQFETEAMMLARLKHPNIVNFYGICIRKPERQSEPDVFELSHR